MSPEARGLELLEIARAAEELLAQLPKCSGVADCRKIGTKLDSLGQVWCDAHGKDLERARDIPGAPAIRRLTHLLEKKHA